jgi:hypothetical protein
MAPKNLAGSQKGFISTVFDEARNPENATIVRSLAIFTVRLREPTNRIQKLTLFPGRRRFPPQQPRRDPPPSVS